MTVCSIPLRCIPVVESEATGICFVEGDTVASSFRICLAYSPKWLQDLFGLPKWLRLYLEYQHEFPMPSCWFHKKEQIPGCNWCFALGRSPVLFFFAKRYEILISGLPCRQFIWHSVAMVNIYVLYGAINPTLHGLIPIADHQSW